MTNIMFKKRLKIFIIIGTIGSLFLVLSYFLNVPSVKADDSMLIRELLFTVEDSQGDAIGVKIMENPQRLPPLLWYNQNVSNPASPSYFAVDNYYALRDGRTVYVGAPNLDNTSGYEISSYIYIFSYNEGASSETINIFNQLLENLRFNHNINNLTEKRELQRDLLRIYDFSEIENSLNNYYNSSRRYPALSSGTYVLGKTYTTWPSWQYTLSSELGQSLPVDPINRFNGSCSACPDNTSQPDYQCSGTCYNPMTGDFIHPNGSHVYEYYAPQDISCDGQGYSLYANLEYKPDTSDVVWLGALPTENIIIDQDDSLGTYNYSISQGIGECGNGILNMCEECECNSGGLVCTEGNFMPEKTCLDLGLGAGIYASGLQCVNCHWRREVCDKMDLGANCTADAQCLSGYCSDGVCCDTSCQGLCQSCNNNGICQLVGYGDDPRNVCAEGDCSLGFCDGFGSCELESAGISCGTCQYCSVDGQCLNTPSGEDYGTDVGGDCVDNTANCEAGYCDGYGSCSYCPEGFVCDDCKKCSNQTPSTCNLVPSGTDWGTNFVCNASGNFTCYNNWANCDSDWANGCESYLLTNNQHCGACYQACHDNQICLGGNCACNADWGDCDSNVLNGCETYLLNDFNHCGSCPNSCITHQICHLGDCVCGADWGDCDEDPANGCEIDLSSTFEHCGSCGNSCSESEACSEGICVDPPLGGGCSGQPVGASCGYHMQCDVSSDCVCEENWGDCNNDETDGCETNLLTTWLHCDMCNNACGNDEICENGECIDQGGGGSGS